MTTEITIIVLIPAIAALAGYINSVLAQKRILKNDPDANVDKLYASFMKLPV